MSERTDGNLNDRLNDMTRGLMDFFFPRRCPFCGRPVGRERVCRDCETSLPRCDRVLHGAGYGAATAPLWYDGDVRRALLDFKFKRRLGGLDAFGQLMAACAKERYDGAFDDVTWVPVSARRLKKRGFDQARFLCASFCVDWHTEPVETLRKVVDNPAQSSLPDREQRRANVLGVYEAVEPERIAGKRWLLIDDLMTTGATLSECVRVLKEAGAADVVCLTLAVTPPDRPLTGDKPGE